jgi:Domain of Unknown Function (DUF1080)
MVKFSFLFFATLVFVSCSSSKHSSMTSPENQLTTKEKNDGWVLLFDGKSMDGWHSYGEQKVGKVWTVKDGAISFNDADKNSLTKEDAGDLVTNEEYDNFDLKLDWKIGPKGNSGIIFYIHEDPAKYPATYNTGLEMQILDNGTPTKPGHPDGKIYTHRAGDLYDLLPSKEVVNPQGEWNHIEVKSLNGKLDFYMNGEHTLSTTLWDDNWKQMVAISKFKNMPGFGTFKKGKISLQDHGEDVWFRNIKIKRL